MKMLRSLNEKALVSMFSEDWGRDTHQYYACADIYKYLATRPACQLNHITIGSLRRVITCDISNSELINVVQYLCGDRVSLLQLNFEFIDESDEHYELTREDVNQAKSESRFVHPATGEYVESFEEKIFLYFTPGKMIVDGDGNDGVS